MKDKQKLKKIAQQMVELDKEIQQKKNVKQNTDKLMTIALTLSFEEMLFIDNYIMTYKNKFFDK